MNFVLSHSFIQSKKKTFGECLNSRVGWSAATTTWLRLLLLLLLLLPVAATSCCCCCFCLGGFCVLFSLVKFETAWRKFLQLIFSASDCCCSSSCCSSCCCCCCYNGPSLCPSAFSAGVSEKLTAKSKSLGLMVVAATATSASLLLPLFASVDSACVRPPKSRSFGTRPEQLERATATAAAEAPVEILLILIVICCWCISQPQVGRLA